MIHKVLPKVVVKERVRLLIYIQHEDHLTGKERNMQRVFLIDSENVGESWLPLLNVFFVEDELSIFFTNNTPNMSYRGVIQVKESRANIRFVECFQGRNALDFQLCAELGYRYALQPETRYTVVSNDTGYDAMIKFLRKRGAKVQRIQSKDCVTVHPWFKEYSLPELKKEDEAAEKEEESAFTEEEAESFFTETEEKEAGGEDLGPDENRRLFEGDFDSQEEEPDEEGGQEVFSALLDHPDDLPFPEEGYPFAESDHKEAQAENIKPAKEEDSKEAIKEDQGPVPETIRKEEVKKKEKGKSKAAESQPVKEEKPHDSQAAKKEEVDQNACLLYYAIGKNKLMELHQALQLLYGTSNISDTYAALKAGHVPALQNRKIPTTLPDRRQAYVDAVFHVLAPDEEEPRDFSAILLKLWAKKKNLNSFRPSLISQYGAEKGEKYYNLFKGHIRILDKLG